MPEYAKDYLIRFQHTLQKLTDQPHKHTIPVFDATKKYAKAVDTSNKLDDDGKTFIQQFTGTFLYYAWEVDPRMLVSHSAIASSQESQTEEA